MAITKSSNDVFSDLMRSYQAYISAINEMSFCMCNDIEFDFKILYDDVDGFMLKDKAGNQAQLFTCICHINRNSNLTHEAFMSLKIK